MFECVFDLTAADQKQGDTVKFAAGWVATNAANEAVAGDLLDGQSMVLAEGASALAMGFVAAVAATSF